MEFLCEYSYWIPSTSFGAIVLSHHVLLARSHCFDSFPTHFILILIVLLCQNLIWVLLFIPQFNVVLFSLSISYLKQPFSFRFHSCHCASSAMLLTDVCLCCVHVKIHWNKYFIPKLGSWRKIFGSYIRWVIKRLYAASSKNHILIQSKNKLQNAVFIGVEFFFGAHLMLSLNLRCFFPELLFEGFCALRVQQFTISLPHMRKKNRIESKHKEHHQIYQRKKFNQSYSTTTDK